MYVPFHKRTKITQQVFKLHNVMIKEGWFQIWCCCRSQKKVTQGLFTMKHLLFSSQRFEDWRLWIGVLVFCPHRSPAAADVFRLIIHQAAAGQFSNRTLLLWSHAVGGETHSTAHCGGIFVHEANKPSIYSDQTVLTDAPPNHQRFWRWTWM